jgi:hypothetical protein
MTFDVASARGVPGYGPVNSPAGNCLLRHLSDEKRFCFLPRTGKVTYVRVLNVSGSSGMRLFKVTRSFSVFAAAVALASCGGGGGSSSGVAPPPPDLGTAEGLWNGTTADGRSFSGLVLDDGTYWFLYSAAGNTAVFAGAVQGTSTSSGGKFTSSNGLNFSFEGAGILSFTMSGTYTANAQLGGTLTYASGTNTFTSSYDTDYDLLPSLATIAGNYSGQAVTVNSAVEATTVMVASGGAITGTSAGGCSFTGSAMPRASGNVYDITVTFGGGVCDNGTGTVTGVAYYVAAKNELIGTALNSARTNGFIFVGTKP